MFLGLNGQKRIETMVDQSTQKRQTLRVQIAEKEQQKEVMKTGASSRQERTQGLITELASQILVRKLRVVRREKVSQSSLGQRRLRHISTEARKETQARQQDFSCLHRSRGNPGSVRPRTHSRRSRYQIASQGKVPTLQAKMEKMEVQGKRSKEYQVRLVL